MKTQLTILKRETKHCRICFEPFTPNTYSKIGVFEQILCKKCLKKFKHRFIHYQIEGIKALAIYDYDENMRQLIYQFKGCGDYELYPVFLNSIKDELKMMYHSYQINHFESASGTMYCLLHNPHTSLRAKSLSPICLN